MFSGSFPRVKIVSVSACGKQKKEKKENDKNVIYVLLLASIYIKVCMSFEENHAGRERKNKWEKAFR